MSVHESRGGMGDEWRTSRERDRDRDRGLRSVGMALNEKKRRRTDR